MLLTPRYGARPVMAVEVRSPGPHPVLQQRRRLDAVLADLSDEEWQAPSRCEGWTVQDVATHLVSTNGFWALSIQAGVAGEPTQLLGAFDPVASPAQMVERERGTPPSETLAQLAGGTAALAALVDGLSEADWDALGEAPPGHLPIRLVADHALWDAWVHERDIVLPLGRTPVVDAHEVATCLRYSAGLGRAFGVVAGAPSPSPAVLDAHDPDVRVVVEVTADAVRIHDGDAIEGSLRGEGDAVELLEMLSLRDVGRDPPAAVVSLTAGLATVFDQPVDA